jgi:indolepyruvate ferredoxin oxidoreductase beta subunit
VENIIVMGILSRYMPFPLPAWEEVIKKSVPAKTIEINLAAFGKGREIAEGKA